LINIGGADRAAKTVHPLNTSVFGSERPLFYRKKDCIK
jgi:hypothetical protein